MGLLRTEYEKDNVKHIDIVFVQSPPWGEHEELLKFMQEKKERLLEMKEKGYEVEMVHKDIVIDSAGRKVSVDGEFYKKSI